MCEDMFVMFAFQHSWFCDDLRSILPQDKYSEVSVDSLQTTFI